MRALPAGCRVADPQASWVNERILAGPQGEDRRSGVRARHGKERGRSRFRGEPLISEALRRDGEGRRAAHPEEETRLEAQAGREGQEPAVDGPRRTSLRHPLAEARILEGTHRYLGE